MSIEHKEELAARISALLLGSELEPWQREELAEALEALNELGQAAVEQVEYTVAEVFN